MSHGYVVRQNEFENLKKELEEKNFWGKWFPEGQNFDTLFNREYAWSSGFRSVFDETWIECEIETEEKIITKQRGRALNIEKIIDRLGNDQEIGDILIPEEQEWEQVESVKKTIGQVMPTYSRISWNEEYDASQEEAIGFNVPCKDIIDSLQLEQKDYDGYFYSKNGTLVAFDGNLSTSIDGLLIRKEYLDEYLARNNLSIFWICVGEKRYVIDDMKSDFGEWSGLLYLEKNDIIGSMTLKSSTKDEN